MKTTLPRGVALVAALTSFILAAPRPAAAAQGRANAGEYSYVHLSQSQVEAKAKALLRRMTLPEKVRLLIGHNSFYIYGVKRLHIPPVRMSDASVGVRVWGPSTAYPASICLAATWDRALARREGAAIGQDCLARGVHIILGPGMNIEREPQDGRNFEFLGEDPALTAGIADAWIRGLQAQDVAACAKHYVGNDQETDRSGIDTIIGRRALEEIYLYPFRHAVERAHTWTIMAAYNRVNGHYNTNNYFLLTTMLRHRWGFKGVLMSDWGATHNTIRALNAGLDLDMPNGWNAAHIVNLVKSGRLKAAVINEHVLRILRMIVAMGFWHKPKFDKKIPLNNPKSARVAMQVAAEGTVLLKNRGHILPLRRNHMHTIVVTGPMATPAVWGGGGSSEVTPIAKPVSLLAAIRQAAGPGAKVEYVSNSMNMKRLWGKGRLLTRSGKPGLVGQYYNNMNFSGKPVLTRTDRRIAFNWHANLPVKQVTQLNFSMRWRGEIKPTRTGYYQFVSASDDGSRVYINGKRIINNWNDHAITPVMAKAKLTAGKTYRLRIDYYNNGGLAQMEFGYAYQSGGLISAANAKKIRAADVVIACMGFGPQVEHEGSDHTYALPSPQSALLHDVGKLNPHTIAIIDAGENVGATKWIHQVAGLVWGWYPGENGNTAVANILFGKIDPSGRLPDTFSKHWRDEAAYGHFPGHNIPGGMQVHFAEGIYVGYRWFDKKHIQPRYPFGFGLSYTKFKLGHLKIASAGSGHKRTFTVSVRVTNTGKVAGADVVELYVHPEVDRKNRCVQTLKNFARAQLAPGQSKTVRMRLDWRDFAYFNTKADQWKAPAGKYQLAVGSSSRDEPLRGVVTLK